MGYADERAGDVMKAAVIISAEMEEQAVRELIMAAHQTVEETQLWVLGMDAGQWKNMPVEKVVQIDGDHKDVEGYLSVLEGLYQKQERLELLLSGADSMGNELASRLAYRLGGSCILAATKLQAVAEGFLVQKRVWGLQMEGEFLMCRTPCVVTVVPGSFPMEERDGHPEYSRLLNKISRPDWYEDYEEEERTGQDMNTFPVILAGGRGLGSRESAVKLKELSQALGTGIGGTRPAVLSGWLPTQNMIGLSGHSVSPELCVVFGASGCMPFMGGIDKRTVLAAVNSDPKALIFKKSDIGIVDDCNQIIENLYEIQAEEAGKNGQDE